jgi:5-methylcytosine-specific restriction protein A
MPRRPKYFRPRSFLPKSPTRSKVERDRFYTGSSWRRTRAAFLSAHPLCLDCEAKGLLTAATIPHHDKERLARPDLAFDFDNLVPLCSPCHTARHKMAQTPKN